MKQAKQFMLTHQWCEYRLTPLDSQWEDKEADKDGLSDGVSWGGHDSLSKTILQGISEGGRRRGPQRKCWMDNIKEWTFLPMPELLTRAFCRKGISAKLSLMSPL